MIGTDAEPKLTRNEGLKGGNTVLAGMIAQTLADPAASHFSQDDYEFLKFHGVYQHQKGEINISFLGSLEWKPVILVFNRAI